MLTYVEAFRGVIIPPMAGLMNSNKEKQILTLSRLARVHELQDSTDEATVSPANGGMRIVEK